MSDYPDTLHDYYKYFFRSDHHWNARGAAQAFNSLVSNRDEEHPLSYSVSEVNGPKYSGSYARLGLCPVEDEPVDLTRSFEETTLISGNQQTNGNSHSAYADAPPLMKHYQFYDLYYQGFNQITSRNGNGKAILVCDSFGGALLRPLSLAYSSIDVYAYLHWNAESDAVLQSLLSEKDAEAVIFVGHPGNYLSFTERHPNFFDG